MIEAEQASGAQRELGERYAVAGAEIYRRGVEEGWDDLEIGGGILAVAKLQPVVVPLFDGGPPMGRELVVMGFELEEATDVERDLVQECEQGALLRDDDLVPTDNQVALSELIENTDAIRDEPKYEELLGGTGSLQNTTLEKGVIRAWRTDEYREASEAARQSRLYVVRSNEVSPAVTPGSTRLADIAATKSVLEVDARNGFDTAVTLLHGALVRGSERV